MAFTLDFESAVAAVLQETSVSDGPARAYLAAVSGGADSTALLSALAAVRDRADGQGFSLYCIHVEHGIRRPEESRGDAAFVVELCGKLKVPCRVVSVDPGKIAGAARKTGAGIEAAARQYRMRALFREAHRLRGARILIAHTQDDLLETALMRILRGAGPAGLAAMPVSRGLILRPLLTLSRTDVIRYLTERGMEWREDSTNQDIRFLRNRVRLRLIPQLDELFPHWKSGITALAETQALAAGFIGDETRRRINWTVSGESCLCTGDENFFAQPEIVREEAVFQGVDRLLSGTNAQGPRRATVRRFCAGQVTSSDLGPLVIRRKSGKIVLSPKKNDCSEHGFSLLIKEPGLYTLIYAHKKIRVEVKPCSSGEAGSGFYALPLVVRRTFKGDYVIESAADSGASRRFCTVIISNNYSGGVNAQQSK